MTTTTPHALGFLLLGLAMCLLPEAWPAGFPPGPADDLSASALWLRLMGGVNASVGVRYAVAAGARGWRVAGRSRLRRLDAAAPFGGRPAPAESALPGGATI